MNLNCISCLQVVLLQLSVTFIVEQSDEGFYEQTATSKGLGNSKFSAIGGRSLGNLPEVLQRFDSAFLFKMCDCGKLAVLKAEQEVNILNPARE